MNSDVTTWPILVEFPWNWKLPRFVEARHASAIEAYGEGEGEGYILAFWCPAYQKHVDVTINLPLDDPSCEIYSPDFWDHMMRPMLCNLSKSIFESVYPGEFGGMLRRKLQSEIAGGERWPEADREKWLLYNSLQY